MECVILAAGEGKRMRPLTANRPKVMLPLANRPMMEYLVDAAIGAGISGLILVVGYGEQVVRSYFTAGSKKGVRIRYVTQRKQKGTADALLSCRHLIEDPFIMMNVDMLIESRDIEMIMKTRPTCMGISRSDHPEDYGVVEVQGDQVVKLVEKSRQPPGNLINAGIYHFSPDIFRILETLPCSPRGEYEITDALGVLIEKKALSAHQLASWLDVGYPWDLLEANELLLRNIEPGRLGEIEEGVMIQGPVAIGSGTVVKSGTCIEGPCVIGNDCRIGPHAYIRGATSIGDRCHIGHCTEIKNSIVMADTKIPHFNYLGDSVVGSGCNFGAGTKVANLRHDHGEVKVQGKHTHKVKLGAIIGDEVQFGINCSVNVGAVIGSRVRVSPGSLVDGFIEEGSKIR
jgi:UDP-N-acetylglucosamine diphosphorylase/glucosamine-1-phosphate N-acetyltransferase